MANQRTKNDVAWEKLFDQYEILKRVDDEGTFSILATDITKEREARLMAKFDHAINLPYIFKKNNLSILPDSRRSYVIGRFDCYANLPFFDNEEVHEGSLPSELESILATDLYSEASTLLCAQHAGFIANALNEEQVSLTVFGRMTTGKFDFSINTIPQTHGTPLTQKELIINNAQLEIDGGYEGVNQFAIIEAKNQYVPDFHIRQLYYPYRLWSGKLTKPVTPVFFMYSNDIFSFYIYQFADPNIYNSLELIYKKRYRIVSTEIEVADIRRILKQVKVTPEPKSAPFPQADTFEILLDLLTQLHTKGSLTQEYITTNFAFDVRQTQYYTAAGRYLDLLANTHIVDQGVTYSLTKLGSLILRKEPRARNIALAELILSRKVFNESMKSYLAQGEPPSKSEVIQTMQKAGVSITSTTTPRRAQTVRNWVRWIMGLTAE